ncbi:hypothetical protein [Chromobacterium violaceum]|uniref:Lipoprotein n=2 Tax=Chromobacterium violaceum TaxID=536 RepID=A0A202BET4_CHRVL|nr:hypothetical protein [Chromobacterium violaceum]AAQ62050.1 conserved hypothetical protein [Chromobacterium violaceum ATCC 12472]MBA8733571.1 hypothetical protein [Chromobacterium violaceum]MCD0492405.1 hypothetical protein [Chromobacterium violaceum]OVE50037.1 hypothetical protein CBW21_01930 [Chromobacterium violaceum]QIY79567.1 hypothetical protein FOB43_10365 [Chromobacterium violaceum]
MNPLARTTLSAVLLAVCGLAFAGAAQADETQWQKEHPRRAEVNKRLAKQNQRINQERKNGQISKAEARKLHKEDHDIRQQERGMAKLDRGHITRQEQKTLNQEENGVSRQIKNGN